MGRYVTHRRFKGKADCGDVNIRYGTEIEERNGWLYHNGRRLCSIKSENAHQFFARDDDGNGILRGFLTQGIQKELRLRNGEMPEERNRRWERIWRDPVCQKYKKAELESFWLWSHDFYEAPVDDLGYIAKLLGLRKGA